MEHTANIYNTTISFKEMKIRNIIRAIITQIKERRFFRELFITKNAIGYLYISSHIRQMSGTAKQTYPTLENAKKAAAQMEAKKGVKFNYYKCLYCDGYHIGKALNNEV